MSNYKHQKKHHGIPGMGWFINNANKIKNRKAKPRSKKS